MTSAGRKLLGIVLFFCLAGAFGWQWNSADQCSRDKACGGYRAVHAYIETTSSTTKEIGQSTNTEELVANYTFWLAIFTGGLFAATSGLWLATFRLWQTTSQAVEGGEMATQAALAAVVAANRHADESARLVAVTKENANRQLRAYVAVEGALFERMLNQTGAILRDSVFSGSISLSLKNFGATPAGETVVKAEYILTEPIGDATIIPLSATAKVHPRTDMAPGQSRTINIVAPDFKQLRAEKWYQIKGKRAYLVGRVDYVDAFNVAQYTRFQMVCNLGQSLTFVYCLNGNEGS